MSTAPTLEVERALFVAGAPVVIGCDEVGRGAIAGVVGTMQASEVLKEMLGLGQSLSGTLVLYDALNTTFRKIKIPSDPGCPLCGDQPSITVAITTSPSS